MRFIPALCVVVAMSAPLHLANAADADDDDIVILSVKPRSPDVKPIAASMPVHDDHAANADKSSANSDKPARVAADARR